MGVPFTRQLGAESGVQLNPLRDESEIPSVDNYDQSFGIMLRLPRGRIDKPFAVDRGNVSARLGKGEQIRVSALNEAWVHVMEAVNKGAYQAIVQRLVTASSVIKWIKVVVDPTTKAITFSVSDTDPVAPYLMAFRLLDCHNDGNIVEYRADENRVAGVAAANDKITLRIRDNDGNLMYEIYGSLDPAARDDYGNSLYLPDVAASRTDAIEFKTSVVAGSVDVVSAAYGYDTYGQEKWARSGVLVSFEEGGTAYATADYAAARQKLQSTPYNYGYISSGGSQSPALLAQLAQLAFDTNRQLRFDIPGNLTPEAAITFVEQLNMGASPTAHLMHAFWAPLKSDDPTGVNPKGYFGTATLNIAYACLRNAVHDENGFSPKNYPIAGKAWPIQRTRITQTYFPRDQEYNALAKAKINPVVFETYEGGGRYVFKDSLTCALVANSLKMLISVADMSCDIDNRVTSFAKGVLQLPMQESVKRTDDYMKKLFEDAETAKWLVPSTDPEMAGKASLYSVRPNAARPYDKMDYRYKLRYDGTTRQIEVTQTVSR